MSAVACDGSAAGAGRGDESVSGEVQHPVLVKCRVGEQLAVAELLVGPHIARSAAEFLLGEEQFGRRDGMLPDRQGPIALGGHYTDRSAGGHGVVPQAEIGARCLGRLKCPNIEKAAGAHVR